MATIHVTCSLSFNRALANYVGCSMSGLKTCLLSKNVSELLKAQKNITLTNDILPVVDHDFLQGELTENKTFLGWFMYGRSKKCCLLS